MVATQYERRSAWALRFVQIVRSESRRRRGYSSRLGKFARQNVPRLTRRGLASCWSHIGVQRFRIAKVMWLKDQILSLVPLPLSHNHLAVVSCIGGAGARNKRTQSVGLWSVQVEIEVASQRIRHRLKRNQRPVA